VVSKTPDQRSSVFICGELAFDRCFLAFGFRFDPRSSAQIRGKVLPF
jgi:hypothetical protein